MSTDTFMRAPQVRAALGDISKSHLYALVRSGQLAPPIRLARRWSAWKSSDVQRYVQERTHAG
jgi:predicted DNA-binding transcriptional regulator AlpA